MRVTRQGGQDVSRVERLARGQCTRATTTTVEETDQPLDEDPLRGTPALLVGLLALGVLLPFFGASLLVVVLLDQLVVRRVPALAARLNAS